MLSAHHAPEQKQAVTIFDYVKNIAKLTRVECEFAPPDGLTLSNFKFKNQIKPFLALLGKELTPHEETITCSMGKALALNGEDLIMEIDRLILDHIDQLLSTPKMTKYTSSQCGGKINPYYEASFYIFVKDESAPITLDTDKVELINSLEKAGLHITTIDHNQQLIHFSVNIVNVEKFFNAMLSSPKFKKKYEELSRKPAEAPTSAVAVAAEQKLFAGNSKLTRVADAKLTQVEGLLSQILTPDDTQNIMRQINLARDAKRKKRSLSCSF